MGRVPSEETRRKISRSQSGENNPQYGMTGEKCHNWKGGSRMYWSNLSRKVWEEHHGRKIPEGYLIHHKDENWKNIEPENLVLKKSRSSHMIYHWQIRRLKTKE